MISLNKILEEFHSEIFLKIDIEGFEYRVLDDILKNQNKLNGLVIEFHDFDLHRIKIKNFIDKLSLELVYISPNNYTGICKNGDPTTVELTFSKHPIIKNSNNKFTPVEVDYPNNPSAAQIKIKFK